ncbi:MAG: hypothetical protein JW797_07880 [Bradymonadales bacterium]|nr:hypothetical protein [Bradymonadales bacterium]
MRPGKGLLVDEEDSDQTEDQADLDAEEQEAEEPVEPEEPEEELPPVRKTAWSDQQSKGRSAIWLAALMFGLPLVILIIIEAFSRGCSG